MLATVLALALSAAGQDPITVVKHGNDQVQEILKGGNATVDKLEKKSDEFVDFGELAKRALGPTQWAKLNAKQQAEFTSTMKGLLRASYAQRAISDGKGGAQQEYGEQKIDGNEATVSTTLSVEKDKYPVDYKLYRAGAAANWRIYDVITDSVSLLSTYEDQFRQLIAKKGYDGLLTTLKARRDQLEKDAKAGVKTSATPSDTAGGAAKTGSGN